MKIDFQHLNIKEFIPQNWFKNIDKSSVWVTGYKMANINPSDFQQKYKMINLGKALAVLIFGKLNYLDTTIKVDSTQGINYIINGSNIKNKETPLGAWLMLIQPFVTDGKEHPEDYINFHISYLTGFLAAFNGRNFIFQKYFDYSLNLKENNISAFSPTFLNPGAFPTPDIGENRLYGIEKAFNKLIQIPEKKKNVIALSLHWFEGAINDNNLLDSFTKYWIALEVLSMPDTSNIRPLNQYLADAYKILLSEAINKFKVGIIFGIRSRILHDGERIPIDQYLLEYIESLYIDILFEKLAIKSEKRADTFLSKSNFSFDKFVKKKI